MDEKAMELKMKSKILSILTPAIALLFVGCTGLPKGITPVTGFSIEMYMGTWYEIARLDHSFERNMANVTANYSLGPKGVIRVVNRGFDTQKKEWKSVEGRAKFISQPDVGSLKVSFFGPFYGGYHVIALDKEGYRYAMVSGPNRSYLWILARDKKLDTAIQTELIAQAEVLGFKTEDLILVDHDFAEE